METVFLQFHSGILLDLHGENDEFESWRVDDDTTLIVAGPGSRIMLFD